MINQYYLECGLFLFTFFIRKTLTSGTPVSGVWTDDYKHAIHSSQMSNAWFKQNKLRTSHIYNRLSNVTTTGADGTVYYGPLQAQHVDNDIGNVNYFQRNFFCQIPTNTVIVQYETAICAEYNDKDKTEVSTNNIRKYRSGLDAEVTEGMYESTDNVLRTQCESFTHSDNYYWIQSHEAKWNVDYMNNTDTQYEVFDVTIRIDVHNNDAALLFGITVECADELQPDDSGSTHAHSKHPTGMIDGDSNFDSTSATHALGIVVGTVFGICIGIIIFVFIGCKCMKHFRLKSQMRYERQLNEEIEAEDDHSFIPIM